MPKYNSMFDVAFTIEHDYEDPNDVPPALLIEACQRRLNDLRANPQDAAEAFGESDTYENEESEPGKIKCDGCGMSIPDAPEDAADDELLCNGCHELLGP